eukprot:8014-Heterococcus_DN1.PRE.2
MLSSSSKNSTQGAEARAFSNTSLTLASLSPNHMVSSSGPLMLMKLAWHSLATALAMRVLPQPGGPVLNRVLHKLLQLALDALQAANVLPRHIRHLYYSLSQRGGVADA